MTNPRNDFLSHLRRKELEAASELEAARETVRRASGEVEGLSRELCEIRELIEGVRSLLPLE